MYELTILLDENNKIPLYEQIYVHIRDELRCGKITAYKTALHPIAGGALGRQPQYHSVGL